jgi:hypothetical protein
MWNMTRKRKPTFVKGCVIPTGLELRAVITVLRLVKGWVLAMLVPPAKNGRPCAWLRSRRAEMRGAFDQPCAP